MNRIGEPMPLRRTAIAFAIIVSITSIFGGWSGPKSGAMLECGYNSNAAQLSDENIALFDSGDPAWMRLQSTDDGFSRIGIDVGYRFRMGKMRAEAGLDYRFTKYFANAERDYHFIRPNIDLRAGRFRGEAAFAYIPKYSPTLYGDVDEPDEARFWMGYSMVRGELDLRYELFQNHSFGIAAKIEDDRYCDHFPEYDGQNYRFGPTWRWNGPVYLKLQYAYRVYNARGYDAEGETAESSDETDISYVEDRFEGYLSRNFKIWEKGTIGATWKLSQRFYTSEKPFALDYIHVGRRDRRADIAPFIDLKLSEKIAITSSYQFTIRDADSPYYDLDPVKDYSRSMVAIKLEYSIR